jgi:phosphonate transport system substrate-binding protein
VPRGHLLSSGIDPSKDFARFIFAGGHDKVAFAVAKGEADAGALYKPVFDRLVSEGKIGDKEVMAIWESPPFADFPWVVSGRLDKGFQKEIKEAFLTLNDPKILDPLKAAGYREVSASAFEAIKEYAEKFGFIKPATKKK